MCHVVEEETFTKPKQESLEPHIRAVVNHNEKGLSKRHSSEKTGTVRYALAIKTPLSSLYQISYM